MNNKVLLFFIACFSHIAIESKQQGKSILDHFPEDSSSMVLKNEIKKDDTFNAPIKISEIPSPPPVIVHKPVEEKIVTKEEVAEHKEPQLAKTTSLNELERLEDSKKNQESEQKFRLYFEDATLENVVKYIETLFKIKFLPDSAVTPLLQGGGSVEGHKVSFKTNRALSREQIWDIFVRLLDLAGLALVPGLTKDFYRITSVVNANKEAIPVFF